jgi:GDP-L-fucose synthase
MEKTDRIFVAGHNGLVGSAIFHKLIAEGYKNVLKFDKKEFDLRVPNSVEYIFKNYSIDYVFLAAAKVGGIMANSQYKGHFIYDNLMIQTNVIHNAYTRGVKKLLFFGSSCIYPKFAEQPIKEDYFLSGKLEESNDAYAIAKIAGIKMCQSYTEQYGFNAISLMPTNLYGPNDNFNLESGHVLPALIKKIHTAKIENKPTIEVWGTGKARREFTYVYDLADAAVFLMNNYDSPEIINVGVGEDITIKELVYIIASVVGYKGDFIWDRTKPDGTPRKLLNVEKLNNLGWKAKIKLEDGIKETYKWYKKILIT